MSLVNSTDNPSETPLSHLEDRTILTKTDKVEGLGWGFRDTFDFSDWWKSNCATLPAFTFRVAYSWPTHPTITRLRVSLASSIQLTMTIRKSLTPTTCNRVFLSSARMHTWAKTRKFSKHADGTRDGKDEAKRCGEGPDELLAGYVVRNHPLPRMMTADPLSYSRTCCGRWSCRSRVLERGPEYMR